MVPRLARPSWHWMTFSDTLAGGLDRMRMTYLMRREAPPDARLGGVPRNSVRTAAADQGSPPGRAVDYAEQRARWELGAL